MRACVRLTCRWSRPTFSVVSMRSSTHECPSFSADFPSVGIECTTPHAYRQKELWTQAERTKREQWTVEKTKEIKETTVRGLEPEIQRLVARHKEEVSPRAHGRRVFRVGHACSCAGRRDGWRRAYVRRWAESWPQSARARSERQRG